MSAHGGTFGRGSTGASGGRLISLAQKIFNFGAPLHPPRMKEEPLSCSS